MIQTTSIIYINVPKETFSFLSISLWTSFLFLSFFSLRWSSDTPSHKSKYRTFSKVQGSVIYFLLMLQSCVTCGNEVLLESKSFCLRLPVVLFSCPETDSLTAFGHLFYDNLILCTNIWRRM